MSGMEPMLIGAALGGGISAARGGNPLTGALLGGLTGGIGGSVWNAAGQAASAGASNALASGIAAQPALSMAGAQTAAGQAMANPSIWATMKEVPSAIGGYMKANPMESLKLGQSLLGEQQPVQPQQAMLAYGTPMQMAQDQQYSMGAPKISLIQVNYGDFRLHS